MHDKFAANQILGCNSKQSKKIQWDRLAEQVSQCGPIKDAKQIKAVRKIIIFYKCYVYLMYQFKSNFTTLQYSWL